jgi:hypothetical protein
MTAALFAVAGCLMFAAFGLMHEGGHSSAWLLSLGFPCGLVSMASLFRVLLHRIERLEKMVQTAIPVAPDPPEPE